VTTLSGITFFKLPLQKSHSADATPRDYAGAISKNMRLYKPVS
jgi:hypothetical protein